MGYLIPKWRSDYSEYSPFAQGIFRQGRKKNSRKMYNKKRKKFSW